MVTTSPFLFRALHHLAESGYTPEADSAFALCRATCWSEPIARGTRHLDFRHARSCLEDKVRVGYRQRMGWLVDRGGVEARVWEEGWAEPRWKLALFDVPSSLLGDQWPVLPAPASHALAREMLIHKVGGVPHGGFLHLEPTDFGPRILGPLAAWRAANPGALVANVCFRGDLTDADFVHLAGIKALNMAGCSNPGLTDAAFVHLRGLHTLVMQGCTQLTDGAFAHLHGLHTLWIDFCNQPAITDAAFLHLRGIQVLIMIECNQATITGATLAHLRGVSELHMAGCSPEVIAAARALGLCVMV